MDFRITVDLKQKSSGYGDKLTNSENLKTIIFTPKSADYNKFAYLKMTIGTTEVCIDKDEVKRLIKALECVL